MSSFKINPVYRNDILHSEVFSIDPWVLSTSSLSEISIINPAGDNDKAWILTDEATNSYLNQYQNVYSDTSEDLTQLVTASIYFKKNASATWYPALAVRGETSNKVSAAVLDLDTGSATAPSSWANWIDPSTYSSESAGDWYRLRVTQSFSDNDTSCRVLIYPALCDSFGGTPQVSETGSAIVWGAQIAITDQLDPYQKTSTTKTSSLGAYELPVVLEPQYSSGVKKFEYKSRTSTGNQSVYKHSQKNKFKIPVRYVNSEFKSVVNSWYENNTEVIFTVDSTEYNVLLTGKNTPINSFDSPYTDQFKGIIELETF